MLRTLSKAAIQKPGAATVQSFLSRQGQRKPRGTAGAAAAPTEHWEDIERIGDEEEEEDSTVVVSGGYDYAVALRHAATGELIHEFLGHEAAITGIAYLDRGCPALGEGPWCPPMRTPLVVADSC